MFRRFLAGYDVSTHSRLKAAGLGNLKEEMELCGFNTQPPEGGWFVKLD